jgi:crossover junction endodeoxyribonuclease RusA
MLAIDLPWPPTVNTYWRSVPGRGVLISADGRRYRQDVQIQVLIQRAAKKLAGRLDVQIYAFPPDKRRRDLDNLFKGVLDSLTHAGVWLDDQQIDVLSIRRGEHTSAGALRVEVKEIGHAE